MRAILCVGFSGIALANPGLRRAAAQLGLAAAERVAASEVPINVRRFMRCILPLREEKGTAIRPKKKGGLTNGPPLELKPSELEAQAELHAARQVSAAGMQESRRGYAAWIAGGAGWPNAVRHTRCVTKIGPIGDAKRSAGLCDGDARDLPSS